MKKQVYEILTNQISVDQEQWQRAKEDKKRIDVLNWDALFDKILKNLLVRTFSQPEQDKDIKELFDIQGGPLSSLSNKAKLAYALGLIDKTTCDDLKIAHKIRNKFAHGLEIDFTDSEVVKLVNGWRKNKKTKATEETSHKVYLDAMAGCFSNVKIALKRELDKLEAEIEKAKKKGETPK